MRADPPLAAVLAAGALALALALALAGAVTAATPAKGAADSINARRTHASKIDLAFKAVRDELAKPAVDKAVVVANADTLALYAPQIGGWLPKGPGSAAGLTTSAKDRIGSDPKGFLDQTQQFEARTKKFQAIAHNGDVAEMKTSLPQLAASCKSCHDRFGAKDQD